MVYNTSQLTRLHVVLVWFGYGYGLVHVRMTLLPDRLSQQWGGPINNFSDVVCVYLTSCSLFVGRNGVAHCH